MTKQLTLLLTASLLFCFNSQAIVIRHDVADSKYLATANDFLPLATLYQIGVHGTLIHPQWVVTAAHTIFCIESGDKIKVAEQWVEVDSRYAHADYQLDGENDIALIKLKRPLTTVKPANIYRKSDEEKQKIWFIGSGGTGTGEHGQTVDYKENKGQLRKAENRIEAVSEREIFFVFDSGADALPLEGVSGNADSGGPAYQLIDNQYYLLGVSSRADSWFKSIGEYGVDEVYSRVSFHAAWIDKIIAGDRDYITQFTTQYHFAQDNIKDNLPQVCEKIGFN